MLLEREVLARPLLYLSVFFKRHREDYYGWLDFSSEGASNREGSLEGGLFGLELLAGSPSVPRC